MVVPMGHHVLRFPDEAIGYLQSVSGEGQPFAFAARGIVPVPVGARFHFASTEPSQLSCLAPLAPDALVGVGLNKTSVQDADLLALAPFTGLREINLSKARAIGDAGMAHLRGLGQLETLDLYSTRVSDAGLVHLSALTSLRHLHLGRTRVRGGGLRWLSGLSSLRKLSVEDTPVDDTSIVVLRGLVSLRELVVRGSYVTTAGAEAFLEPGPSCLIVGDLGDNAKRLEQALRNRRLLSVLVHRIVPNHPIAPTLPEDEMADILNRLLPAGTRLEATVPAGAPAPKPVVTRVWDPDPALILPSDVSLLLRLLPRDAGLRITLPGGSRYSIPWLVTRRSDRRRGGSVRLNRAFN
jgi:hypothetical protein